MRKILSIILAISILCTMAITPVVAEDVVDDGVVLEETTPEETTPTEPEQDEDPAPVDPDASEGEGEPEATPDAGEGDEPTDPEGGEGEDEGEGEEPVAPEPEVPEIVETPYKVLYTLPSLLNANPKEHAQDLIATNQETIKLVFTLDVGDDYEEITFTDSDGYEPAGGVYKSKDGNKVTLKFGELKLDTEYIVTVPATMQSGEYLSTPATFKFRTMPKKHLANADFSTWEEGTYTASQMAKDGLSVSGDENGTFSVANGFLTIGKTATSDTYVGSKFGTREVEYEYPHKNEDGSTEIRTTIGTFDNMLSSAKVISLIGFNKPADPGNGANIMLAGLRKSQGFLTENKWNQVGISARALSHEADTRFNNGYVDAMFVTSMEERAISDDLSTTTVAVNAKAYDLNSDAIYTKAEATYEVATGSAVEAGSASAVKNNGTSAIDIKYIKQGFYFIPEPMEAPTWDESSNTLTYIMNTDIDLNETNVSFGDCATDVSYNEDTRELSLRVAEDVVLPGNYTIDFNKVVSVDGIRGFTTDTYTIEGGDVTTFGITSTLPSRLNATYGKNIAVNQGTIKVKFAEEIVEDGTEDITFTDADGNAPKGGIFTSVSGDTLTIKFGELNVSTTYNLRLPTSIKSVNENIFEGKTLEFKTIGQKELINHDFSDTTKWPADTTYAFPTSEAYFSTLNPNATGYFRLWANKTATATAATLKVTSNGTLNLINGASAGALIIGGNFVQVANVKIVSNLIFKANKGLNGSGDGFGGLYNGFASSTPFTGSGTTLSSNMKSFKKDGNNFYDITMVSERTETAVNGTKVTYSNAINAKDNIGGTSATPYTSSNENVTAANNTMTTRIAAIKSQVANNNVEIASIKQGFYTFPAPLSEAMWDAETKTLSYVMNTDIDMEKSTVSLTGFPTDVSYDEATRTISLKAKEAVVFSGDYTVDLTGVVSADGFKCETTDTVTIEGDDFETFGIASMIPTQLNAAYGKYIGVNQGTIKVTFAEEVSEGLEYITFTDADGKAPKGGIFLTKEGATVTIKFGELDVATTYNLRLPTNLKTADGKIFEGKTLTYTTVVTKVLADENFSDTTKWPTGNTYTPIENKEIPFSDLNPNASKWLRVLQENTVPAGDTTLTVTQNGTLQFKNGSVNAKRRSIGSNYTDRVENGDYLTIMKFKVNANATSGTAYGFGALLFELKTPVTADNNGNGLPITNMSSFAKDDSGFYDVTIRSKRDAVSVADDGTTINFSYSITPIDNKTGKTGTVLSGTNSYSSTANQSVMARIGAITSYRKDNDIEIASLKQGFFTLPAPLADGVLDEDAKTITYVMNTDIDLEDSDELKLVSDVFGELPVVATFDAETRKLVITYEGALRDGYDYALNLSALVSADGLKVEKDDTINNGKVKPELVQLVQTFPTRLHAEHGKNIGVNQETIKLIFDEELKEGYNDITFTDPNGNAPKGKLFIEKDGTAITVKFGELTPSTTYTLTLPQTLVSVSGKIFEGQELTFNTTPKVLINEDFTDTTKWIPETEFVLNSNEDYFYNYASQSAETSPRFRVYYHDDAERAGTTLKTTSNGTLEFTANAENGNRILASNPLAMSNIKVVSDIKFKASFANNGAGTGFGSIWSGFNGALTGNGMPLSNIKSFSKDNGFYDITLVSERKETAVSGSTISFEHSINATDNISGAVEHYVDTSSNTVNEATANTSRSVASRVVVVKAYNIGDTVEFASIRQGHYSIPAALKSDIDLESKTLTFNMNTDIESYDALKLTSDVGEMPITVSYDEPERTLTVKYEGELRNGYDYTLNFKDIVSVDGFNPEENVVFNNGENKEDEATLSYTLPSRLNGTDKQYIGPNQETITLVFSEDIASGYEDITFTDADGKEPKGGVVVTANGKKVTVKFGELETGKDYTVNVPSTLKTTSDKFVAKTSVSFTTMPDKELINANFADLDAIPETIKTRINNSAGTITVADDYLTMANTAKDYSRAGALFPYKISTAKIVSDIQFAEPVLSSENGNGMRFGGFWKANFQEGKYKFNGVSFKDMAEKGFTADEDLYNVTVVSALSEKEIDLEAKTTVLTAKATAYDNVSGNSVTENYTSDPLANGSTVETDSYSFATVYHANESLNISSVRTGFFTIPAVLKAVQNKEENTIEFTMNTDIESYAGVSIKDLNATITGYNEETRTLTVAYEGHLKDGFDYAVKFENLVSTDGFKAYNSYTFNNGLEKEEVVEVLYTLPTTTNAGNVIAPNQGEIKVVFTKDIANADAITFTDENGKEPIGGVEKDASEKVVTLKFGELNENATYTVKVPASFTSADGSYAIPKDITFTTTTKAIKDVDFTTWEATDFNTATDITLPDGMISRIHERSTNSDAIVKAENNSFTIGNGDRTYATLVGKALSTPISSANIVANVKFAEPELSSGGKGIRFGGVRSLANLNSTYDWKGASFSSMNEFVMGEDDLYDITVLTSFQETGFGADDKTTYAAKTVAYDNISGKLVEETGTADASAAHSLVASYALATVSSKNESVSLKSAKIGYYTIPAIFSEIDNGNGTISYVMNTDINAETINNITVNGEKVTPEYIAAERTIVLSGVPENAEIHFYGVFSVDGFQVEIPDNTPVEEPVEFAIENNAVTVEDGVAKFSFDYTNDEAKTVQVVIAEYHGNKLAKVEIKNVELDVTTNELVNYTIPEGFTLENSEADNLKVMATIWNMTTLEALCGAKETLLNVVE